jgi:beta-glucosidase
MGIQLVLVLGRGELLDGLVGISVSVEITNAPLSWNRQLATERAHFMAGEFRAKGVNVALGPGNNRPLIIHILNAANKELVVVGPLGRIARGGRNWEGFSHDPYLSGLLAADTIKGHHQRGVMTSLKHFILNEQETNRKPFANTTPQVEAVSSNVDDKTMHELYLWCV